MSAATRLRAALTALARLPALILPIVMPSWRFFDVIAPAPHIEFGWADSATSNALAWRPFLPTPATIDWPLRLRHLWSNAARNETLYLLACADQVCYATSARAAAEIRARLERALANGSLDRQGPYLCLRIRTVVRVGTELQETVAYSAPPWPVAAPV